VILLAAIGCQQELVPPPVPPPLPPPAPVAHTPFLIHDLLVGEDGAVIRKVPELTPYDVAKPDGAHRFKVGAWSVDTATNAVTKRIEPAVWGSDNKLVRYEPDGRIRWTQSIPGPRSVRPPDLAVGGGFTLVAADGVVRAFDDANGTQRWTSMVHGDRLQIAGDLAYSTMCNEPTNDHWLIGTSLADGAQKFRANLSRACDPWLTVTDRFLVVVEDRPANTRIFDLHGKLLLELDEQTEGAGEAPFGGVLQAGTTTLLVTDKHVIAVDPNARVLWMRDHMRNTFVGGNQVVALPGGDFILANFGAINDSGIDLVRFHADGSYAWHSCSTPLGVGHSEYEHFGYIEARGDALFVASEGSYGAFLEKLAIATGERQLRCVLHADQNVAEGCTKPQRSCPE